MGGNTKEGNGGWWYEGDDDFDNPPAAKDTGIQEEGVREDNDTFRKKENKSKRMRLEYDKSVDDIDVTYYYCDVDGCEYKTKQASNVKLHKANIHDIDITYYYCEEKGCEYKAKTKEI